MRNNIHYQERKLARLCTFCGKQPAKPNRVKCADCTTIATAYNRRRRNELTAKGICYECKIAPVINGWKKCGPCERKYDIAAKANRQALKIDIFNHYGGCICNCCGETQLCFLSLDHINNDGAAHRKEIDSKRREAPQMYRWVKRNNYPSGFQVLCFNCNHGRHINGGVCPHKTQELYEKAY